MTAYVDVGNPVDVLYLDFSKAFDMVPHKRLVKKVKAHGIGSNIWRRIEVWLSDIIQGVVINGYASGWESVTSVVPQGSVLGPTFFIIYINDIDDLITSSLADDTKLLRKVGTQDDAEELQRIYTHCISGRRIGRWCSTLIGASPFTLGMETTAHHSN